MGNLITHVVEILERLAPQELIRRAKAPALLIRQRQVAFKLWALAGEHLLELGERDVKGALFGAGLAEHRPQRIGSLHLERALGTTETPERVDEPLGILEIPDLLLSDAPDILGD